MSFVVKKRDLTDPAQLQALIVEHADDLERGLSVLDSRLLLGHASMDIVAVDAAGVLVLIAVGLVGDEEMLLKAIDAYSWCLEYPEAIHRLYPTVQSAAAHPPRVMFVVERMPDAFHRKIKQLGFAEVDCVEFRHLDVDGTPAMYFDTLARLQRAAAPTASTVEHNGASTAPAANGRPTSLKLQKLLGADRPVAGREPAPVVRIVQRTPPRSEPKPVATAPRTEHAAPWIPAAQPTTATSTTSVEAPPPARRAPVAKTSRSPSLPAEVAPVASVSSAIEVPELIAQSLETVEAMVEPFVTGEPSTQSGAVGAIPVAVPDAAPEPAADLAPRVSTHAPEPETIGAAISAPEPEVVVFARPDLEPRPVIDAPDSNPTAVIPAAPLVSTPTVVPRVEEWTLPLPESEPAVIEPRLEPPLALITEPAPAIVEPHDESPLSFVTEAEAAPVIAEPCDESPLPLITELAPSIVEPRLESLQLVVSEPEPTVAELSVEPPAATITMPEPAVAELTLEALPSIDLEPALSELTIEPLQLITESEPAVADALVPPLETHSSVAPKAAPASVFSKRPLETKVSFAGMAKDILPPAQPTPETAPPVSIQRPSVEDITRAALDELVGATENRTTEERSTAFAKPSGAFSKSPMPKRPRTIAAPPTEGQALNGGGAKLGAAPKPNGLPVTATEATPSATDADSAQAMPEGFEGLQFPNDGVLTRQWMEFLNQMAAGK